jgi:hypothetical protein
MCESPIAKTFECDCQVCLTICDAIAAQLVCHGTDDSHTCDATDGVGHGMQNDIRVAVARQGWCIIKDDAPEYQRLVRIALNKAMTI